MEKISKYILAATLCVCCLSSGFAQTDLKTEQTYTRPNWYIEAGGGAQLFFSSDASKLDFKDRITPAVSLTVGKWISPYWGLRLQAQGYSFNGNSTTEGLYLGDPLNNGLIYGPNDPVRNECVIRPDGSYRHYLRYINAHFDLQASLFNLIGGYKANRVCDLIPAVGIGYAHTFPYKGTPDVNVISTNFSLMFKCRLPKGFDLNLEAQSSLFPDQFDGRITGKMYENNCALTLGITYNFKSRKPKTIQSRLRSERSPRKIHYVQILNPEAMTGKVVEVVKTVNDTVVVNKEVKVREEVPVKVNEPFMLGSIHFGMDKTVPARGQEITFVNIAKYLDKNPDVKLLLSGYADQKTGTPEYNLNLSTKRGIAVRDILVKKYNVDRRRIEVQGVGTDAQPYEQNKWNRVVIVTAIQK